MTVQTNQRGLYILPEDSEITLDIVKSYIQDYDGKKADLKQNYDMYCGTYDILKTQKEAYKPNNKLVVNFAKYIVDTFNGYFIGVPIKTSSPDDKTDLFIQNFSNECDLQDNEAELAKMVSIFGRAFELLYTNANSEPRATYFSPLEGFMVYDDTIEEIPLFAVRYYYDDDTKLHGTVYTRTEIIDLSSDERKPHYFGGVPVIEYIENDERQGTFDSVKTLMNELNKALSEKANDVDYFADAYLKVIGAALDEDTLNKLRDSRIINLPETPDGKTIEVAFLEKPNSDTTQENLLNRLTDLIYQISMIANITDETFSSAASGVSLEFKLLPMKNLAAMKERKFQASLRQRWRLVFSLPTNRRYGDTAWRNIEYQFTRNMPNNIQAEATTMAQLEGLVSQKTILSLASFVKDVPAEIKRLQDEKEDNMRKALEQTENLVRQTEPLVGEQNVE